MENPRIQRVKIDKIKQSKTIKRVRFSYLKNFKKRSSKFVESTEDYRETETETEKKKKKSLHRNKEKKSLPSSLSLIVSFLFNEIETLLSVSEVLIGI